MTSCDKCDICKNYLKCFNCFTCSVTNRKHYTRRILHCNCNNVIYLITCKNCREQYVGSATNFMSRFEIHESGIKTNKDRCRTAKNFDGMYKNGNNIFQFFLFKLLNKIIVMPQTLNKIYGAEKNVGNASYLP